MKHFPWSEVLSADTRTQWALIECVNSERHIVTPQREFKFQEQTVDTSYRCKQLSNRALARKPR
jgi:hypothetical protein